MKKWYYFIVKQDIKPKNKCYILPFTTNQEWKKITKKQYEEIMKGGVK